MLILVSSRREHQNCREQIRPEFSQTKFLQAGVQVKENFFSGKTMSNTSYYLSTLFMTKLHTWLHLSTQCFCFVPDSISLSYLMTTQLSIRFCTEQDKIAQAGPRAPSVNFFWPVINDSNTFLRKDYWLKFHLFRLNCFAHDSVPIFTSNYHKEKKLVLA